MTLDDLISVWQSQDTSPFHGVNETLLRLALREDEARLQKGRRQQQWIVYCLSAFFTVFSAVFIAIMSGMLFFNDDDVITGWDLVIPVVGAVAALLMGVALYLTRRAQARREQRFGDSLRDQLGRQIAQLDDAATGSTRTMGLALLSIFVFATAMRLASLRMNLEPNEPFDLFDDWPTFVRRILIFAIIWAGGHWAVRRAVEQDTLPRKNRLEALLKELDG